MRRVAALRQSGPVCGGGSLSGPLWNRDFLLLWQGRVVSNLGTQASFVAMMLWTLEATGSPGVMGLLLMASTLPGVVLGPVGGAIADRHSRKTIIVWGDAARGAAALAVATSLHLHPESPRITVAILLVTSAFGGVVGSVFSPAVNAAIPDLVSDGRLAAANSLNHAGSQGSILLGQAFGGVLYVVMGPAVLFLVDGISFLLSAGSEAFIRLPHRARRTVRTGSALLGEYWHDTAEGIRYTIADPGRRGFILLAAGLNFLFMPIFVLLPVFVEEVLIADPHWYGWLLAGISGGSLVGLSAAGAIGDRSRVRGPALVAALLGTGGLMAGLGAVSDPPVALAMVVGIGALTGLVNVLVITLLQLRTPREMRGRMMAVLLALTGAATPLGMGLGGLLGEAGRTQIPAIYAGCGAAALLFVTSLAFRPGVRGFLAGDEGA